MNFLFVSEVVITTEIFKHTCYSPAVIHSNVIIVFSGVAFNRVKNTAGI